MQAVSRTKLQEMVYIAICNDDNYDKWKNHFFKMKGGYRDGLKHQKGRNKGSLHSKVAQSYMTPSLYLCFIVYKQS